MNDFAENQTINKIILNLPDELKAKMRDSFNDLFEDGKSVLLISNDDIQNISIEKVSYE